MASHSAAARADLVADTALTLLAERGMRGLTHRAVDEAAGLPQGSTSNHARTRLALLETAVRRLAEREASVLALSELPPGTPAPGENPGAGPEAGAGSGERAGARGEADTAAAAGTPADLMADALSLALHRYLTRHRALLVSRYELALEATRRPELREVYDAAGRRFQEPLAAMMAAAGSAEPERHALSLTAWSEGMLFSCAVGGHHAAAPSREELRRGFRELLRGALGEAAPDA
ncbi:TetR/AcrR family transcriptional regulator [Streptomyces sp. NBC_00448]|uniref:TetR/AcrR family transcriptional regulator n=1 Tax=Streptomyces sp. NBC_00448 TaxID=2903652 RepID=UPI002E23E63B